MADAPVLEALGLSKRFAAFQALHDVSFQLRAGEVVGFLGANGAGKSTTMKILTGYLAPSAGQARVVGHDLREDPLACRRAIGYLPEELPLYLDMRVDDYLDHVARLKGMERAVRRRAVIEVIESAQLMENAHRHIRKLSKGNRQRVGLAQALIGSPRVLILDEPTSGLDPTQVQHFRALLRRLSERHAILLSTHILSEVEASCSRAVIIHRGRTIADESVAELRRRAAQGTVLVRLRSGATGPFVQAACELKMAARIHDDAALVTAGLEQRAELAALAERHGGLREMVEQRLSLEDVFRDLIAAREARAAG